MAVESKGTRSESIIKEKIASASKRRQQYQLFFSIGLTLSLSMVLLAFEWKRPMAQELVDLGELETQFEPLLDITITEQAPPTPPKQVVVKEVVLVPEVVEVEEDLDIDLDVEIVEETVIEALVSQEAPADEISDEIFEVVEEQAQPHGGLEEFYQYVADNLVYPRLAMKANVEGKVYVQFVVDRNGNISQVTAIKGLGYGCDEAAVKVIQESPKWQPARQMGRPVNSRIVLPLSFKLG